MSKRELDDGPLRNDGGEKESKRPRLSKEKLEDWPTNWPTELAGQVYLRPTRYDVINDTSTTKEDDDSVVNSWFRARYQYATTSEKLSRFAPKAIVYVTGDEDVLKIVNWARANQAAIACRSGGHHYLGFSSTNGENVQIDLSGNLFHTVSSSLGDTQFPYHTFEYNQEKNLLRVGAGLTMTPFNDGLMKLKMSLPHGECMDVRVGGHCQTGGYSPLARTHGLLLDYIREIDIITADGEKRKISRDTRDEEEQDIFYSTLGGSPGNLGVITHVTVEPIKDSMYPKSRGLKASYIYKKDLFKSLLQVTADWADDDNLSQYYTCSLAVISSEWNADPEGEDHRNMPDQNWSDGSPVPAILLWLSYSGKEEDKYDPSVFQKFKDAVKKHDYTVLPIEKWLAKIEQKYLKPDSMFWGYSDDKVMPLSEVVQSWKWTYPREFNLPFIKRNVMCPAGKDISKNGWVDWTADWIDRAVHTKGLKVGAQYMPFSNLKGGFRKGNDGKTSEAWRNTCMFAAHDVFYNTRTSKKAKEEAEILQKEFDAKIFGDGEKSFFQQDRRLIWAPFGDQLALDDKNVRSWYYDNDDVYQRILKTKKQVDRFGVFSPNEFCIGYANRNDNKK